MPATLYAAQKASLYTVRKEEGKSLGNGYRDGLKKKPCITQVSMTLLKLSAYNNQLLY